MAVSGWVHGEACGLLGEEVATVWRRNGTPIGGAGGGVRSVLGSRVSWGDDGESAVGGGDEYVSLNDSCDLGLGLAWSGVADGD